MLKRLLRQLSPLLLVLSVMLAITPVRAHAATWNTSGTCEWSVDSSGALVVRPANDADEGALDMWSQESGVPWSGQTSAITSVRFEGTVYASTCLGMFSGCSSLRSVDLANLNISQATNMASMFSGCSSLTSLNLSGLDPWQVTTMASLFSGCSSLTTLDLSSWETSEVTDLSHLFDGCARLKSVKLASWDTANVHDFTAAFRGCAALASLDLSNWDTSFAYDMASLFEGCSRLSSVTLGEGFSFCGYEKSRLCNLPDGTWTAASDGTSYDPEEVPDNRHDTYRHSAARTDNTIKVTAKATQTMTHTSEDKTLSSNVTVTGAEGEVTYTNVSTGDAEFFDVDPETGEVTVSGWTAAGTYTVNLSVSANGDARHKPATVETSYKLRVDPTQISNATVAKIADATYTGSAVKPEPVVKWGGDVLVPDMDYTLSYKSNVNAGTATVVITGKGSFKGTKTATFKIKPTSISKATFGTVADQVYNKKGCTPTPSAKHAGKTLKSGTDFTLSYSNNVKVSANAKVTITGKGNFTGSKTLTFRIAFSDVPKSNALYQAIHRAADLGIINGYSGSKYGKFGPTGDITRGQIAVMLWNMAGKPQVTKGAKTFTDVTSEAYYAKAVAWASSVGVVNGYTNGKFGPNDNITREQLAVMVANYARKVGGAKVSGSAKDLSRLADGNSVSDYAVSSVAWCFKEGIFLTDGGRLRPQHLANRATAAQMAVDLHDVLG